MLYLSVNVFGTEVGTIVDTILMSPFRERTAILFYIVIVAM